MILLLVLSLFSQADSKQLISKCTNRHQQLAKQCKTKEDVSKTPGVAAGSAMAYLYDNCTSGIIHTLFLDHLPATATAPSLLTCTVSATGASGTKQEVHTSLDTSLIVEAGGSEVQTTVQTKDGVLVCKSTATGSEGASDVWWCGVMLKRSSSFVEIQPPLALSDMSPALYGKKALNAYLTETPETVVPTAVKK